jgi:hypothetical protein
MAGPTPKKEPTASEAMFFFAIVKHTRNKADIDWAAVATEQGFKNAEVAKVRFLHLVLTTWNSIFAIPSDDCKPEAPERALTIFDRCDLAK